MNESALNTYHPGDQWIKACGFNEADIIRRLLDEGADVEQEASNPLYRGNFSPLLQACRHGRLDTARLLLDRGAAVDRVMYGGTPLMIACGAANNTASEHNIDVVRLLLDRGADVNHTVAGGTPLLSALGWPDAVRLLLDRGARVDYGSLVLHAVSMRGRLNNDDAETLRLLLEHGASPHRVPPMSAPLFEACRRFSLDAVRLLLAHGADPNADDRGHYLGNARRQTRTCLQMACFHQEDSFPFWVGPRPSVAMARMLLGSGATVDTSTYLRVFGRAPLQLRCFKANGEPALRRSESVTERLVPSNAKPLQKLFLKHYTILVRLHAIGTPSTRQGPDRWLLEARTHAPRIASFLSPAPTRLALAAFPGEPDRRWSCKDLLGDGSRRKLESFYK